MIELVQVHDLDMEASHADEANWYRRMRRRCSKVVGKQLRVEGGRHEYELGGCCQARRGGRGVERLKVQLSYQQVQEFAVDRRHEEQHARLSAAMREKVLSDRVAHRPAERLAELHRHASRERDGRNATRLRHDHQRPSSARALLAPLLQNILWHLRALAAAGLALHGDHTVLQKALQNLASMFSNRQHLSFEDLDNLFIDQRFLSLSVSILVVVLLLVIIITNNAIIGFGFDVALIGDLFVTIILLLSLIILVVVVLFIVVLVGFVGIDVDQDTQLAGIKVCETLRQSSRVS